MLLNVKLTFVLGADHPDDEGGGVFARPLEDAALRAVRVHSDPLPAGPGAQVLVIFLPGDAEAHTGVCHHLALHPHLIITSSSLSVTAIRHCTRRTQADTTRMFY